MKHYVVYETETGRLHSVQSGNDPRMPEGYTVVERAELPPHPSFWDETRRDFMPIEEAAAHPAASVPVLERLHTLHLRGGDRATADAIKAGLLTRRFVIDERPDGTIKVLNTMRSKEA